MARADVPHPDGSDLHQFLYAFVGADRDGFMVTVLSTLARLGLDPWKEASELADLSEEAAEARLGVLLAEFSDVPALSGEKESITRALIALLPRGHATCAAAGRLLPERRPDWLRRVDPRDGDYSDAAGAVPCIWRRWVGQLTVCFRMSAELLGNSRDRGCLRQEPQLIRKPAGGHPRLAGTRRSSA